MLESIEQTGFGVLILGGIGSVVAIVILKVLSKSFNQVSPDYSHEVHVFKLLFNTSRRNHDDTDHTYLIILSCAYTLGLLMLTCTSAIVFQIIQTSNPNAYYALVALFITTVLCLYGVVRGLDTINRLLDLHLNRSESDSME